MALNIENIIAEIKEASILELNDLVKAIEEEFGVTAAAPVAVAGAAAGGGRRAVLQCTPCCSRGRRRQVYRLGRSHRGMPARECPESRTYARGPRARDAAREGASL